MIDVEQSTAIGIDWRVVARSAAVGFAVIVPISVVGALVDDDRPRFDHSGWAYLLFLGILVAYAFAGWLAGTARPDAPLSHGALAAVAALVAWVPFRIVIWLVHDNGRGLVTGHRPAVAPGQVFGQVVIGAAVGMAAGVLAARRRR
jgi:hypothetical protein